MPSDRTLRDYVNWAKPTTGFSTSVDNQLLAEAAIGSSLTPSHHQYVCLVFDECKIKEDLIYNKHSGELIGYTDVSGINGHLSAVEQSLKESVPTSKSGKLCHSCILVYRVCIIIIMIECINLSMFLHVLLL